jgi:cobalamin synthase
MKFGAGLLFGVIAAIFARRRGYNWLCWLMALGLIGMIVVLFLPSANKEGLNEAEKNKIIKRGNLIGIILTVISILFTIFAYLMLYSTTQG